MSIATTTSFERDYTITEPVARAIATQLVKSGAPVPGAVDLATSITGIGEIGVMKGAPQLTIAFEDPDFHLLESGFFGADAKGGRLKAVEINYPEGSKYHWRLRQVSPKADGVITTYWIPRVVRKLMDLHGPVKASRASRTRAQFLKFLCSKVPEIRFHSKQLDVKQKIEPVHAEFTSKVPHKRTLERDLGRRPGKATGSPAKSVGLSSPKNLTVKGSPMTASQQKIADVLLQVCDRAAAGRVATVAMIYAGIWESSLSENSDNGTYWGVLSGSHSNFPDRNTVAMAESFLHGGRGFKSAISLSTTVIAGTGGAPLSNPAAVASQAEGAIPYDSNGVSQQYHGEAGYPGDAKAVAEAEAIVDGGGGATGGAGGLPAGVESVQQYNYEVGSSSEPNEDYWKAMNRLAEEVLWELVVDGPDIYFDSDITLVRARLTDTISRTDKGVVDWAYDWDEHDVATSFTLTMVCDEFAYRGGDAVKLEHFGPAASGSTIGLAGRWLVAEVSRNPGDIISEITFVQPERPKLEPATTEKVQEGGEQGEGGVPKGIPAPASGHYRSPPTQGPEGVGGFQGVEVALWIIPMLEYAQQHGWRGKITSGYRPGPDPHTATGASEHQGTRYPHGAIDFGGYEAYSEREDFFKHVGGYKGLAVIPAQFPGDGGHASGTGH